MWFISKVLARLLICSVPLQGFASATALFCASDHGAELSAAHAEQHHGHGPATHDHSAHRHGDDAHALGADLEEGGDQHVSEATSPHQCGLCAACCKLLAIEMQLRKAPAQQFAYNEVARALPRLPSVILPVPRKPPRL